MLNGPPTPVRFPRLDLVLDTRRHDSQRVPQLSKMLALLVRQSRQLPTVRTNAIFFGALQLNTTQCAASQARLFSTTSALAISRKPESKIRIPSKKALAAKTRRKAAMAAKEEARFLKLPLNDAIAVLRVGCIASLCLVLY